MSPLNWAVIGWLPVAVKLVEQVAWFDALSATAPHPATGVPPSVNATVPIVRESGRVPEATDSVAVSTRGVLMAHVDWLADSVVVVGFGDDGMVTWTVWDAELPA